MAENKYHLKNEGKKSDGRSIWRNENMTAFLKDLGFDINKPEPTKREYKTQIGQNDDGPVYMNGSNTDKYTWNLGDITLVYHTMEENFEISSDGFNCTTKIYEEACDHIEDLVKPSD